MNSRDNSCCISNILEIIVKLQNCSESFECGKDGCDRPFLGPIPTTACYNTRPINLYHCEDGTLWEFNYTLNGTTGTSSVFRCEQVDDTEQATIPYVSTNSFFTINLKCVGAITCLADTYVSII